MNAPEQFTLTRSPKIDIAIYRHVWHLEPDLKNQLGCSLLAITTVSKFISLVEPECYPDTYEDSILHPTTGNRHFISYLFTSGQYLEDMNNDVGDKGSTPLALHFRASRVLSIRLCLVRCWDKAWTRSYLMQQGAVEL